MRRAHKIEELQQNPHVEACWYFTGSREQFRLTGTALVVDKDTEDGELQKVSRRHRCATMILIISLQDIPSDLTTSLASVKCLQSSLVVCSSSALMVCQ